MLTAAIFFFLRLVQIVTLIPIWGMLAYFVHQYVKNNQDPPTEILVLFIVSIIATAWALITMIQSRRFGAATLLTAIVDMLIFGAFIAGVYFLRGVRHADCVGWLRNDQSWGIRWSKHCTMYKAAWALGIINTVLFFITSLLAAHIYRRGGDRVVREKHSSHHHRRRRHY
jgi:hypothetical protein